MPMPIPVRMEQPVLTMDLKLTAAYVLRDMRGRTAATATLEKEVCRLLQL